MDNQQPIASQKQDGNKWRVAAIVFIAVTVLLVGIGTFLFTKQGGELANANKKNDGNVKTIKDIKDKLANLEKGETANGDTIKSETATDANKGYLVVSEWGIKFKLPEGLAGLKYSFSDQFGLVFALDEISKTGCGAAGDLGSLSASSSSVVKTPADSPTGTYGSRLSASAVNGLYFFWVSPQYACGNSQTDINVGAEKVQLIKNMVKAVEPIK